MYHIIQVLIILIWVVLYSKCIALLCSYKFPIYNDTHAKSSRCLHIRHKHNEVYTYLSQCLNNFSSFDMDNLDLVIAGTE